MQVPNVKDAEVDALPEVSLEASAMPLNPIDERAAIQQYQDLFSKSQAR